MDNIQERQFVDYTKAYANRMFKHAGSTSGDQHAYDRASKHLKNKFPTKSSDEVHAELNKHYKVESSETEDENFEPVPDIEEQMRQRMIRWHRLFVIGENSNNNSGIEMTNINQERRINFVERLQESMHTQEIMRIKAEKLAEHMGISIGEAIQQLKAHLVQKTHAHKQSSLKESVDTLNEYMEEIDHLLKNHPDMPEHHKTLLHRAKSAMKLATITAGKGDSKESEKLINHAAEHYHKVVHSLGVRPKPAGQEEAEKGERPQVVHNKMYATK